MIVARRIVAVGTARAVSAGVLVAPAGVLVAPGPARAGGYASLPNRYVLSGTRLFPESIGYQRATGAYFVGSLVDGRILRGSVVAGAAGPFLPAGGDGRAGCGRDQGGRAREAVRRRRDDWRGVGLRCRHPPFARPLR